MIKEKGSTGSGGARKGAGRPKLEPSTNVMFRVPQRVEKPFKQAIKEILLRIKENNDIDDLDVETFSDEIFIRLTSK